MRDVGGLGEVEWDVGGLGGTGKRKAVRWRRPSQVLVNLSLELSLQSPKGFVVFVDLVIVVVIVVDVVFIVKMPGEWAIGGQCVGGRRSGIRRRRMLRMIVMIRRRRQKRSGRCC